MKRAKDSFSVPQLVHIDVCAFRAFDVKLRVFAALLLRQRLTDMSYVCQGPNSLASLRHQVAAIGQLYASYEQVSCWGTRFDCHSVFRGPA